MWMYDICGIKGVSILEHSYINYGVLYGLVSGEVATWIQPDGTAKSPVPQPLLFNGASCQFAWMMEWLE